MKPQAVAAALPRAGNRYDRAEWAGAFGDLGTLLPFVLAYIAVLGMDPLGILLGFGGAMIAVGLYYRTPVPVQPMKAIGAVAATQAAQMATITPQAVMAGGAFTGLVWLVLGATGLAQKAARLVPRPIAIGIILGLGFAFMLEGVKMMAGGWAIAAVGLAMTLLPLTNHAVPAMLVLLLFGAAAAFLADATLASQLAMVRPQWRRCADRESWWPRATPGASSPWPTWRNPACASSTASSALARACCWSCC